MVAVASRRRAIYALCVAFVVIVAFAAFLFAMPPTASPPYGTWNGTDENGAEVTLVVTEDGGFYLHGAVPREFTGTWNWAPVSNVAGILTAEPVDYPNGERSTFNVLWLNPHRIELSAPGLRVALQHVT